VEDRRGKWWWGERDRTPRPPSLTVHSSFLPSFPPSPQVKTPERGFSSAKFLPGSRDTVLVALKSEENSELGKQRTFLTIYGEAPAGSGEWTVLLEETELPLESKFEGIEILSSH
jgi:hypothetical protein